MKNELDDQTYRDFVASRNGRCDICGKIYDKLRVDHSHATGAVRGMLCNRCNSGLGFFLDDPNLFHSAIAYLNKTPIPVKRKIKIPRPKSNMSKSIEVSVEVQHIVTIGAADIGAVIRTMRKTKTDLTQSQAAALCNVGTRFLSDLENGKPTIRIDMAIKVLKAFGIQVVLQKKTP